MALQVKIFVRAKHQILKAAKWWDDNRPAAPDAISIDFNIAIKRLAEHPDMGEKYAGSRTDGVRRYFLNRVGYFIYYKAEARTLQVLAFWHAKRGQQPKL